MNYALVQNQKEVKILIGKEEFITYVREVNKFRFSTGTRTFELDNTKEQVAKILQGMPAWLKKEFKEAIKLNEQQFIAANTLGVRIA